MSQTKLHLEDALDESPQAKSLIDLFEKDTQMFRKFTKAVASSCQKISSAQAAMVSANQELSYYLRLYGKQSFPIERPQPAPGSLQSTLDQFADYIDELSTCFQVLVTQINDSIIYPLNKIVDAEFDELNSLSQMYHLSSEENEQALQKYLRLPGKKEHDGQRKQFNEECFVAKRKFHQTAINYFTSLNNLQVKRDYILAEPMLSLMHYFKLFFKMGTETLNSETSTIEDFLAKTSDKVCEVKTNLSEEINKNNQLIELLQQDDSIYYAEQPSLSGRVDDSLQKSGYLNLRSKFPFLFKWDRGFYFLQNGWIMHQAKNEIVGTSFLEIKSDLTVSPVEIDDRLYTFQIVSQFPKRVVYFQANSQRDMEEWITTLDAAIKDDNRAKLLNYKNTLVQNAERTLTSQSYSLEPNVNFDLKESFKKSAPKTASLAKPQQGDTFTVRFLGSMNVKADKGNEYIHETIRSVMAARAKHNVFKLNELNLIVNSESLSLFALPTSPKKEDEKLSSLSSEELLRARFDLGDLAFWSSHMDNQRLFGFIVKETSQSLKFICLCFESDIDSTKICESINRATQLAFQLLIDDNKVEHFKKMKQTEKEILLHNIKSLPDTEDNNDDDKSDTNLSEAGSHLYTILEKSPNPNFIILDKDIIENYKVDLTASDSNSKINGSDQKPDETDA